MIECDVLIVGGGTGGVAAALAAARRGRHVHLIEETDWIGGQLTAQGVSALDEHEHIEAFGGTASYYQLRNALRDHYRPLAGEAGKQPHFNPGNCWVTRVAFEPKVAVAAMMALLQPHMDAGRAHLAFAHQGGCRRSGRRSHRIGNHPSVSRMAAAIKFRPAMVLDATELGDLLPLVGAEYGVGAETIAETGEPHAQPSEPKPHCVQSFTYVFGLERRPQGERHVIERPARYEFFRAPQPYSLTIEVHGGEIYGEESGWLSYKVFETMPGTKGGLWTYRRLIDSAQFGPSFPADLSMFNWPGNDYREASIIDRPAAEVAAALQDAKRASLGFLHWLQTEAPAEGDRLGAPELRLRPDIMGTADGLAKFPYIRESRRIKALRTVVEQDVSAHFQAGPMGCPLRGFGRRRLVPDRHSSRRPGRRRHQLPHAPVSNPARRAHPGSRSQPDRGGQEHRHDPHHQWLLPPAPRRVEYRRGGGALSGLLPRSGQVRGGRPPRTRSSALPSSAA